MHGNFIFALVAIAYIMRIAQGWRVQVKEMGGDLSLSRVALGFSVVNWSGVACCRGDNASIQSDWRRATSRVRCKEEAATSVSWQKSDDRSIRERRYH
jgi:hypothetical protein